MAQIDIGGALNENVFAIKNECYSQSTLSPSLFFWALYADEILQHISEHLLNI